MPRKWTGKRWLLSASLNKSPPPSVESGMARKDIDLSKIHGRIKFVRSFPDYKVKVVDHFPDLKVKKVKHFANKPGLWKIVTSFPDYKIQIVNHFPDFKIKYVKHFPGVK